LAVLLSERQSIGRSSPGIWDNQPIQRRIHALGRRDLIIAGIARDGEFLDLALSAQYHGYRVHVVADASAGGDQFSQRVAAAAMSAAGVQLTNWVAIMAELTAAGGPRAASGSARVAGALSAVTKYLTQYSTRAIQWGGDEVHFAASKGA
jgi:hypothetical protein